jgi:uncharacterized protein YbjT (DUF2867 family)
VIVVTAAGGRTGAAVVRALRARGEQVRAVVSRCTPRPELTDPGAEVVVGELTQPMPWAGLLDGATALYLVWPHFHPKEALESSGVAYAARCRRAMLDHQRAHGFVGSPRVLTALPGRPPRTLAEHLAALPLPTTG